MLTVYSGYVMGYYKSLSCKSGFKLYNRDSLDYSKQEAMHDLTN